MAEALAIELHTLTEEAASGESAAVDIGERRSAARLTIRRTTLSGTLTVTVETAASESGPWRPVAQFASKLTIHVAGLMRYLRVSWVVVTPVEFQVTGEAHTVYATTDQIELPEDVLDGMLDDEKAEACITASNECEDYLSSAYTMPLVAWESSSLKQKAGLIAAWNVVGKRGIRADGADELVLTQRNHAMSWLKDIKRGTLRPPGIVDSTPTRSEVGPRVKSRNCSRGW